MATEYAQHLVAAANLIESACRTTKNAVVFERLFEIYASNPIVLGDNAEKKTIKNARKIMQNHLKEHPEDARVKFALAKNMVFFSNKEKEQCIGADMLRELSQRPLFIDNEEEKEI